MNIVQPVKHALLRTLSVICTLLVIGGLGWAVYAGIVRPVTKPNPTTKQEAQVINNINNNPKPGEIADVVQDQVKKQKKRFFFGLIVWGVEVGIGK